MRIFLVICFVFVGILGFGQNDSLPHVLIYGTDYEEKFTKMKIDSNNILKVLGSISTQETSNIFLAEFDTDFNVLNHTDFKNDKLNWAIDFVEDSLGNIYILSNQRKNSGDYEILVIKINSNHELIWEKNISHNSWILGKTIQIAKNQLIISCKFWDSDSFSTCIKLLFMDFDLSINKTKVFCDYKENIINDFKVDIINSCVVGTGNFLNKNLSQQGFVFSLNLNAELNWIQIQDSTKSTNFNTIEINGNDILVGGYLSESNDDRKKYYAASYAADGTTNWESIPLEYSSGDCEIISIAIMDTSLVFSGNTNSLGAGAEDIQIIEFDTLGKLIDGYNYGWAFTDICTNILIVDSFFIVSGNTNSIGYGLFDCMLLKVGLDFSKSNFEDYKVDNVFISSDLQIEVSINSIEIKNSELTVYPNPVINTLKLNAHINDYNSLEYKIYDIKGNIVENGIANQKQIDIRFLNSGTYLLVIFSENGRVLKTKFIKQ